MFVKLNTIIQKNLTNVLSTSFGGLNPRFCVLTPKKALKNKRIYKNGICAICNIFRIKSVKIVF